MSLTALLITQGWLGYFLPVERSERAKNSILPFWRKKMINEWDQIFTTSYMTPKPVFGTFRDGV